MPIHSPVLILRRNDFLKEFDLFFRCFRRDFLSSHLRPITLANTRHILRLIKCKSATLPILLGFVARTFTSPAQSNVVHSGNYDQIVVLHSQQDLFTCYQYQFTTKTGKCSYKKNLSGEGGVTDLHLIAP